MFLLSACTMKSKAILPRHVIEALGLTNGGGQRGRLASSKTAFSRVMIDLNFKRARSFLFTSTVQK